MKDEVREDRPKADVVPKNIDAVREVITQYRHVTYREIEASLGFRIIDLFSLDPAQLDNRSKKGSFRLVLQKAFIR